MYTYIHTYIHTYTTYIFRIHCMKGWSIFHWIEVTRPALSCYATVNAAPRQDDLSAASASAGVSFPFLSFPSVRFLLELARWMEPYRPMVNGRMRSPVPVMARTASASASAALHCKCLPSDAMRSTLCSCEMRSNHRHRRNVFEQSRFEMLCGAWKRSEWCRDTILLGRCRREQLAECCPCPCPCPLRWFPVRSLPFPSGALPG